MAVVVYVVKPSERNEPLRYSLRSLATHGPPDLEVWIAGYTPAWVVGVHSVDVRRRQGGDKYAAVENNLRALCQHHRAPEEFVLFNDDFFLLDDVERFETVHRGSLQSVGKRGGLYGRRLARTLDLFPDGLAYDATHHPMPMVTALLDQTLREGTHGGLIRSTYGNRWKVGGSEVVDAKLDQNAKSIPDGATFVSTAPHSFNRIKRQLHARFSKPSRFEAA